jgi:hypothetical protein
VRSLRRDLGALDAVHDVDARSAALEPIARLLPERREVEAGGPPEPLVADHRRCDPGDAVGADRVVDAGDQVPDAGLALLIIPVVNVVLAAVPANAAGGASGLFNTAQQLGGAIGVATIGTIFFGQLPNHTPRAAFIHTTPYIAAAFLLAGTLALILPRTAVSDQQTLS